MIVTLINPSVWTFSRHSIRHDWMSYAFGIHHHNQWRHGSSVDNPCIWHIIPHTSLLQSSINYGNNGRNQNRRNKANTWRIGSCQRTCATYIQVQSHDAGNNGIWWIDAPYFPDDGRRQHSLSSTYSRQTPHMVKIGRNVIVMPGCLMMSAGGITIDDVRR